MNVLRIPLSDELVANKLRGLVLEEDVEETIFKVMNFYGGPSQVYELAIRMFFPCYERFIHSSLNTYNYPYMVRTLQTLSNMGYGVGLEDLLVVDRSELILSNYSGVPGDKLGCSGSGMFCEVIEDIYQDCLVRTAKDLDTLLQESIIGIENMLRLVESDMLNSINVEGPDEDILLVLPVRIKGRLELFLTQ